MQKLQEVGREMGVHEDTARKTDLLRHTKGFAPSPLTQNSNWRLFAGVWHRGRAGLAFQSPLQKEKEMAKECKALACPEQL